METGLTLSGWLFVIIAWGLVITGTLFCFWRVLSEKQSNHRHALDDAGKTDNR